MSVNLESVDLLKNKLTELIERYTFLKEENELLITKVHDLQVLVNQSNENLKVQEERYKLLKVAKTIEGSKKDSRETKDKINALIREIDNCIAKLSQ